MTESPNPFAIDSDTLTGDMLPIRRAVLALGSNLGDREANLQGAVAQLADTPDVWITGVSPVYETAPLESPEGSADYLNAVVLVDTTLTPHTLLERALAIEEAFDRQRTPGAVNEPRTIDVDLITVGDKVSDEPDLRLPHPRAAQRAFVLKPWHDIEPDAELPGFGTVADLLAAVGEQSVVRTDITLADD
ncbi:2-amino-4-hydroxy-6-hydroxymethyldihydropteridine diphosphokinase [Nocardioides sp. Kera G14]|uniref:2-amino-4-hydroxy-6- hydroxymethyldihydropteridine diphosphokinase n=1 Tax=Nocardioides sp. Kera G14 TaxID=2884264 RepID=UPI001D10BA48|nr:2-amino-4-hydroxy-6-hydroxymethyldihydropteridine diphosphokinase [Nocardioides sp. Kera G14]UDY23847.1 2-amino-4-hydroxy-6-hydroxymethyldihydropteridine diphosphokinase [Nocardioides sp. Kera G14]